MLRTGKTLLRLSSGTIRKLAFNFLSDLNIPVFRFAMGIVSIMIPEDMLQSVGVFLCTWCYLHMQVCPDLEVNHMRHYWENATCGLQLVQHYIYALDNQLNTDDYINSGSFSSCWSETQLLSFMKVCVCGSGGCVCVWRGFQNSVALVTHWTW